jgi:hypothetical protein
VSRANFEKLLYRLNGRRPLLGWAAQHVLKLADVREDAEKIDVSLLGPALVSAPRSLHLPAAPAYFTCRPAGATPRWAGPGRGSRRLRENCLPSPVLSAPPHSAPPSPPLLGVCVVRAVFGEPSRGRA